MTSGLSRPDLERFRAAISRRLGLHMDDGKLGFLADVLARRVEAKGVLVANYLDRLELGPSEELRAVVGDVTVGETYFFRHADQLRALTAVALPECAARAASLGRPLSILSAGCASGEEPYSIAILLREHAPNAVGATVLGVDINPTVLEKAAAARYSAWSLRETPPELQRRWFRGVARDMVLDPEVRASVRFEERNLSMDDAELWRPASYDIVLCRNVLMYFAPDAARAVVERITRALVPGGYLFLGHAETLRGLSHDYHLRHTHDAFYYQRRGELSVGARREVVQWPSTPETAALLGPGWAAQWVADVERASERVQALARASSSAGDTSSLASPATVERAVEVVRQPATLESFDDRSLGGALELLARERFVDALALLRELPRDQRRDPDAMLLRAALLTHSGDLGAAEEACTELLTIDELDAGAHYLLALCRDGRGDRRGAIDHAQAAVYLDPTFAMPRLQLGLLARRAGDRQAAQRELEQALVLLRREDASRILLFGGGFGRDALVVLCRAELEAAGGSS